jgi:hypothetical protein
MLESVIGLGLVIVNIDEPVLPVESVADMFMVPTAIPMGILITAVKAPAEVVVMLAGVVASIVESNFMITELLGAKSVPEIVADDPPVPAAGLNTIALGLVIVNTVDPVLPDESIADIVALLAPIPVGMFITAVKVPEDDVTIFAGVVASTVESNLIIMELLAA